ncbi:MAG TPA: alginate lyase family protein, partial [bacterium]|nr:alginate lyase family protein [bacterium]
DFLSGEVEWDLRANHVLRDGLGLAWAARFFAEVKDPRPEKWRRQAAGLFKSQAVEQVLADGGHFERSPMYHLQVMEDFLQGAALIEDPDSREVLRRVWARMAEAAAWACHPDGDIPLLNDAALAGARAPAVMLQEGAEALDIPVEPGLRRGLRHFEDAGLVVWHGESCSVFFDVGPLGPDEQPGHGHADNLTLELSWGGERLFVDPGVYAYDEDQRRMLDRSTVSHNTVLVDAKDSSEIWKIFRVGRRAKPRGVEVTPFLGGFKARAGHDGYDHLPGKPSHFREIQMEKNIFQLTDQVSGSGVHSLCGGFLLAPGWEGSAQAEGWKIRGKNKSLFFHLQGPSGLKWGVQTAVYHPQFGVEIPVSRLVWDWNGSLPFSAEFRLSDMDIHQPKIGDER